MPNKNFESILKSYREILWPIIEKKIINSCEYPKYCQLDCIYQRELDFHLKVVSDYPRRQGKYLRPTLLLLTTQAMGVEKEKAILTAVAMQISEDWILNHDDIEDNSESRRGLRALHKIYGNELALNAGDALHMIMWKVLFENFLVLNKELAIKIADEFYIMMSRTLLGQGVELKWTRDKRFDLSYDDNFMILESKTGYYTIAGPMRLGAIIANASDKELEAIYHFGVILGRSFQIVDDLLDLTSDFAGLKKKGNDIYENKRTIMLLHLIKMSDKVDKKLIKKILDKKREEKTEKDINNIVELMNKYGSLDFGRRMAEKYAKEAKIIFENELGFIERQPYRNQIMMAIDFIVKRKY